MAAQPQPVYVLRRLNFPGVIIINEHPSYTCGRGRDNQVICASMLVSRRHCIFIVHADGLYVRDLQSSNGVYVNGNRILRDTKINEYDVVGIGVPDVNPQAQDCFAYTLTAENDEDLRRLPDDAVVPNIPIKVENDSEAGLELQNQQIGGSFKRPAELTSYIPSKMLKLGANNPCSNPIGRDLDRTNGLDPVPSTSFGDDLMPSPSSDADPIPRTRLSTDPESIKNFAVVPSINVNSIKPDPDNDEIQIIGVCSLAEKNCSEVTEENWSATHCNGGSNRNAPKPHIAKVFNKSDEKSAEVVSKSNESLKEIKEAHESRVKPCKIMITSIQSILPNSSLDRSLQNIRGNNLINKNRLQKKETETNSRRSSDPKDSLSANSRKESESNHSDPKLNLLIQPIVQPEPKINNLCEPGPAIEQSNKENMQYGQLPNGHISAINNVRIKEEPLIKGTDSINVSKCDKFVAKESFSTVRRSKKTKEPTETNYESDEDLFVVAEVKNSESSNYTKNPTEPASTSASLNLKSIKEEPKTESLNHLEDHKTSTSFPIKLKPVKEEPKFNYSEVDVVCLSSDDEDADCFPCSQLFDSVEKEQIVKEEATDEGENEVPETREEDDVILLSDSDDDHESTWFHRLFNSQVYKPSQDFCVKTEPGEAEEANGAGEFGIDALFGIEGEDGDDHSELDTLWKDQLPETEQQDDDVWNENIQSQETAAEEARLFEKLSSSKVAAETEKKIPKSIVDKPQESAKVSRTESELETIKPQKKIRKMDAVYTEKKEDTYLEDISSEEDIFPRESSAIQSEKLQQSIKNFKDSCARRESSNAARRKKDFPENKKDLESSRKSRKLFENEKERRRDSKDVRERPRQLEDVRESRVNNGNEETLKTTEKIDGERRRGADENRDTRKVHGEVKERQRSSFDRERRRYSVDNRQGRIRSDEAREKKKDEANRDKKKEETIRERKRDNEKSRGKKTDHEVSREKNKENEEKRARRKQDEENQKRKELELKQKRKEDEVNQERKKVCQGDQKRSSVFERKNIPEDKTFENGSHRTIIGSDDLQRRRSTDETSKRLFDYVTSKPKNIADEVQKLDKTFGNVTRPKSLGLVKNREEASVKRKEPDLSIPTSEASLKKQKCFDMELQHIEAEATALAIQNKIPQRKRPPVIAPHHMPTGRRRGQVNSSSSKNNDYPEADSSKGDVQNEAQKVVPKNTLSPERISAKTRRSRNKRHQPAPSSREERERKAMERKEKLKQVELDKKSNLEEAPLPVRPRAAAIAKVTTKTRQDLLIEQQVQPIAHCSKLNPEVENLRVSSNKIEEICQKKDESHHQLEISPNMEKEAKENKENLLDLPPADFEQLPRGELIEFDQEIIKKYDDLKLKDATNNINVKYNAVGTNIINGNQLTLRRSCLAPISINGTKKKNQRKVRFNDNLNTTRMYEIEAKHSLNRVVGKDAPINRNKPPCQYKLDEYLSRIFDWNPAWLEEQKNLSHEPPVYKRDMLRSMKNRYNSFEEYCNYLRPLLLLEIWNTLTKESECDEKKYKFRSIYCSVVRNSVVIDKNSGSTFRTSFLMEILLSSDDFKKDLYPGAGHLIIFEYSTIQEDRNSGGHVKKFHKVFAYVKSKSHTTIRPNTHYNRDLKRREPNGEILVTLNVVTKEVPITTDQVFRMRGVMYLKLGMREIQALQNLPASPVCPLILNPLIDDYQLPEMYETERNPLATKDTLNKKQIEAVMRISEAALSDKPKISLIHGPPGTGKSKVIVNIVAQILLEGPGTKMLLCAPSNAAIDEIVLRLLGIRSSLNLKNLKMVRVGRPETMNPKVKNVSLAELGRKQVEKDNTPPDENERMKNESTMTKLETYINMIDKRMDLLRKCGHSISYLTKQRQDFHAEYKALKNKNNPVDVKKLSFSEVSRLRRDAEELLLSKANVIACTLSSCYSGMMEKLFGDKSQQKIEICIVDEATQSCETESLIPLMLGVKKMILVGDTNQLPATILSKTAKENGLDQSLFSRLEKTFADQAENPIIMLDTQYRMDYPISSWPNSYFYKGKLKDQAVIKYVPYNSYRVLNLNSIQDEGKFSNTNEAEFVSKIVYIMVTSVDLKSFKEPLHIGVITPYQSQRNVVYSRIERRLDSVAVEKKNKVTIEVNTVDSFQGQERDIIIMSCVRTKGIGFMSDKQRLCVALTRAKSSLILCGNFKTFERDEMWNELLTDAKARDIYIDVEANASLEEIKSHVLR